MRTPPAGMPASVHASVVFLKIQEFARRSASEQARLRAQLEAVAALATGELEPASRVVLEASDGTAIVVLRDPRAALHLAERSLAAVAVGLPLCIGINHGPLQLASEQGTRGMAGDGIAVAATAAEFADDAARLLVSRSFHDALADFSPGAEAGLVPAGVFADPGLRNHELFRPDAAAARRRARRQIAAGVLAVLVLVGGGVGVRIHKDGQQAFMDSMLDKYRSTAKRGGDYWRGLFRSAAQPHP